MSGRRVVDEKLAAVKPTYEWQTVPSWKRIPPGVESDPPLPTDGSDQSADAVGTGTERRVRIPPQWSLKMPVAPNLGEVVPSMFRTTLIVCILRGSLGLCTQGDTSSRKRYHWS